MDYPTDRPRGNEISSRDYPTVRPRANEIQSRDYPTDRARGSEMPDSSSRDFADRPRGHSQEMPGSRQGEAERPDYWADRQRGESRPDSYQQRHQYDDMRPQPMDLDRSASRDPDPSYSRSTPDDSGPSYNKYKAPAQVHQAPPQPVPTFSQGYPSSGPRMENVTAGRSIPEESRSHRDAPLYKDGPKPVRAHNDSRYSSQRRPSEPPFPERIEREEPNRRRDREEGPPPKPRPPPGPPDNLVKDLSNNDRKAWYRLMADTLFADSRPGEWASFIENTGYVKTKNEACSDLARDSSFATAWNLHAKGDLGLNGLRDVAVSTVRRIRKEAQERVAARQREKEQRQLLEREQREMEARQNSGGGGFYDQQPQHSMPNQGGPPRMQDDFSHPSQGPSFRNESFETQQRRPDFRQEDHHRDSQRYDQRQEFSGQQQQHQSQRCGDPSQERAGDFSSQDGFSPQPNNFRPAPHGVAGAGRGRGRGVKRPLMDVQTSNDFVPSFVKPKRGSWGQSPANAGQRPGPAASAPGPSGFSKAPAAAAEPKSGGSAPAFSHESPKKDNVATGAKPGGKDPGESPTGKVFQRLGPKLPVADRLGPTEPGPSKLSKSNRETPGSSVGNKDDPASASPGKTKKTKPTRIDKELWAKHYLPKCPHCTIKPKDYEAYAAHLQGDTHKEAMTLMGKSLTQRLTTIRVRQRQEQQRINQSMSDEYGNICDAFGQFRKPIHCKLCKLMYFQDREEHDRSKFHNDIVAFLHRKCRTCDLEFKAPMVYFHHMSSTLHLQHIFEKIEDRNERKTIKKPGGEKADGKINDGKANEKTDNKADEKAEKKSEDKADEKTKGKSVEKDQEDEEEMEVDLDKHASVVELVEVEDIEEEEEQKREEVGEAGDKKKEET